jgi:hypothetical protein
VREANGFRSAAGFLIKSFIKFLGSSEVEQRTVKRQLRLEIVYRKSSKFGEPFKMAIPSQIQKWRGVETIMEIP